MTNWEDVSVADIIQSANTGLDAIKRAPIVEDDTGIKCLRIQDISQTKPFDEWGFTKVEGKNFEKFRLRKGDIIIARTGATVGVNLLIKQDVNSVFNNGLIRIRVNEDKCLPEFLFYNFRTQNYDGFIESISGGTSTQPNMQINALLGFDLKLPNLREQNKIVSLLVSLDEKMGLLHRQNATLEIMAETLFRQWFVKEANDEWETKRLSSVANFLNGLACQKFPPKNGTDKLPVLKIRELSNGITENSDWASTDVKMEYIVKQGDVIFAWSASLMVKIWNGEDCILNQHLFKVTSAHFPKWFYYLWCKHHLEEFSAKAASHATTMGHIKRGDLDDAMVLIPSPKEIEDMTKLMKPILEKIIINNTQIRTLTALRDSLLPKLVSGEVSVSS